MYPLTKWIVTLRIGGAVLTGRAGIHAKQAITCQVFGGMAATSYTALRTHTVASRKVYTIRIPPANAKMLIGGPALTERDGAITNQRPMPSPVCIGTLAINCTALSWQSIARSQSKFEVRTATVTAPDALSGDLVVLVT